MVGIRLIVANAPGFLMSIPGTMSAGCVPTVFERCDMPLALLIAGFLSSTDLTSEDLRDMAQENVRQVESLRVTWRLQRDLAPSGRTFSREQIARGQELLGREDLPPEIRQKIETSVSEHQKRQIAIAGATSTTRRFDYWSDRQNFQVRSVPDRQDASQELEFPDLEATRERLPVEFADVRILSWGPSTKFQMRIWEGKKMKDGSHLAVVKRQGASIDAVFPPLALPAREWSGTPHPIDDFIERYLTGDDTRVIGEVQLGKRRTILVDCIFDGKGARAFLDPSTSGMPVRIEFFTGPTMKWGEHPGVCTEVPLMIAAQIVRDIEYQRIENMGRVVFYPVRGLIQEISRAASPDSAISAEQPTAGIHTESRWDVEALQLDREMTESGFALEFPPQTVFINETTNETYVTGDADGHAERLVRKARPELTGQNWSRWMIPAIAVGIAFVVIYWRRQITRRAA